MKSIPEKTLMRLTTYRRIAVQLLPGPDEYIRSGEIARLAQGTPAQVRRDLMELGCHGKPCKGYRIQDMLDSIARILDPPADSAAALVGVGNLGHALLSYLAGRKPNLNIRAVFDNDPAKRGLSFNGCICHSTEDMEPVIRSNRISIGILAVPAACAQETGEKLALCGITGILNFAPVKLNLPSNIYVQDMDISAALERVAFFARKI